MLFVLRLAASFLLLGLRVSELPLEFGADRAFVEVALVPARLPLRASKSSSSLIILAPEPGILPDRPPLDLGIELPPAPLPRGRYVAV